MASVGDDATLIKVAVFGIAVSLIATAMIAVLWLPTNSGGDYTFDEVQAYRNEQIAFSGESMLNQSPWVLTHVFTPYTPDLDASTHVYDGWLFGQDITDYPDLNKSANIHLDVNQKSSVPITYTTNAAQFDVRDGYPSWVIGPITRGIADIFNIYNYKTVVANDWDYTGYRYYFDPTLPFSSSEESGQVSTRDGSLSLVWYSYNGQEGLSGGIDVYGGQVLLASYSATDIIAAYNTSSGYATTYDFDFQGTILTLSIRFDQSAIDSGATLMQAWTAGQWSMQISSTSAGNFFDIDGSTSFTTTAGGMIKTFIQILTFSTPSIDNPWMDMVLWLIVGLPMMIALLCVTLRLINGFRVI